MNFHNSIGYTLFGSVTVTTGAITPGGVILHPGPNLDTFQYIPGPTFAGGWVYFTITYTDSFGVTHECKDSVFLQQCKNHKGPRGSNTISSNGEDGIPQLSLVPNPAQNSTRVNFATGTSTAGAIEVYDITGRLMNSYAAPGSEGSWLLQLDNYAAGLYIVVLKENGLVVKQQKLAVTR